MKQSLFVIEDNIEIASGIYKMTLMGDTSEITNCGQFVNIKIDGYFLRRPISVCDYEEGRLTLLYKAVGCGTSAISKMRKGEALDILSGLGNGYDISRSNDKPLLVGGGVGVPPLYNLAKKLTAENKQVLVALGFNTKNEAFYIDEFTKIGCNVSVATCDGSMGVKGYVTDAIKELGDYSYFYACGPEPMLKAVYAATGKTSGEFSFEERMGCGFGACMGCTCQTITGGKRICKEGPVLRKEEILWKE